MQGSIQQLWDMGSYKKKKKKIERMKESCLERAHRLLWTYSYLGYRSQERILQLENSRAKESVAQWWLYGETTQTSHFDGFSWPLTGSSWLNHLRVVHCHFVTNTWLPWEVLQILKTGWWFSAPFWTLLSDVGFLTQCDVWVILPYNQDLITKIHTVGNITNKKYVLIN